jgi:hypothetical protein
VGFVAAMSRSRARQLRVLFYQVLQAGSRSVEDRLGVQRRDDFGPKLINSVLEHTGDSNDVHLPDHCDELASVGVSFALARGGVGSAPRLTSEGELCALSAGGKNLGAETGFAMDHGGSP